MGRDEPEFGGFEDHPAPIKPSILSRIRSFVMDVIRSNEYLSAWFLEDPKPSLIDHYIHTVWPSEPTASFDVNDLEDDEHVISVSIQISDTSGTDARIRTNKRSKWVRIGK